MQKDKQSGDGDTGDEGERPVPGHPVPQPRRFPGVSGASVA